MRQDYVVLLFLHVNYEYNTIKLYYPEMEIQCCTYTGVQYNTIKLYCPKMEF